MTELKALGITPRNVLRDGLHMRFSGEVPEGEGALAGEDVEIELTVPPLNFASIRAMQAQEAARSAPLTPMQMLESVIDSIEQALKRNYRNVPRWLIEQSVDVDNALEISQQLAGITGLVAKKKVLDQAAETTPPSTGTPSTRT